MHDGALGDLAVVLADPEADLAPVGAHLEVGRDDAGALTPPRVSL